MHRNQETLRKDALQIWHAGVEAVKPAKLIPRYVVVDGAGLQIGELELDFSLIDRIVVVGAGKAGADMVVALEAALGDSVLRDKQVTGWVNVPADCVRPSKAIHLHAARAPGSNQPTADGVAGTEQILQLVGELTQRDLCIALISGGGSALMPAPVEGISLQTKTALTREIAARGGNIHQLNSVRRELSRVKGGGLARACRAGQMVALMLSDVLGDDLATIASGPTVLREPTPEQALQVLRNLDLLDHPAALDSLRILKRSYRSRRTTSAGDVAPTCRVTNVVIGNNATAVDAAGMEAERLGYSHAMTSACASEGMVEAVAERLVAMAQSMRDQPGPDCLISGGEPTVKLCEEDKRGLGGRNQQLALAALARLVDWRGLVLVSGGTDGEDGPTDAAGAIVDEQVARRARQLTLDPHDYLHRNDAYHFFERVDGLLRTGPTHTNVCDVRVICVSRNDRSRDEPAR